MNHPEGEYPRMVDIVSSTKELTMLMNKVAALTVSIVCAFFAGVTYAADDIVVADFEGADYEGWIPEGVAFGTAPAQGTLSHQGPVSGYMGKGLVNSFLNGDSSKGTLTSPAFTIQRKYMSFLVGGGNHEGEACINLIVDGKILRSHTGPNDERLRLAGFEVSELMGQKATLQILDNVEGNWGHINIDDIIQTDRKPDCVLETEAPDFSEAYQAREMTIEKQYLIFPISGDPSCNVVVSIDGESVRIFDASLAARREHINYWSYTDMSAYRGKTARIRVKNLSEEGFELITQADTIPAKQEIYTESLRPQFHFTPKIGWCNDANGLVYYDGEWHLFFQHNPYATGWGNMHWGHAVSPDLLHWEQLPHALYPWSMARSNCFSGSAAVDWNNTSGFQTGKEKPLVIAFTDMGCGESLAYSNDRGRTWTYYEGNPLFEHRGRDPKITWYKPTEKWVMAVFDETIPELGSAIAFYTSKDMKNWQFQSRLAGYHECTEVFELPVDGDPSNTRWVIFGGDAMYALGDFDGKSFTPEHEGKHQVHHGAYYASQLFNDAPGNRKVQIGWAKIDMPGMPFNQMQSFPSELSLRTTDDGIRMFVEPVEEISALYTRKHSADNKTLTSDTPVELDVSGDIFDISATFELGDSASVALDIGGNRIGYDAQGRTLNGVPLKPVDGRVIMRVLLDRPSIEIFGNDGRIVITAQRGPKGQVSTVKAFADGGNAKLVSLEVNELESVWK